MESQVFYMTNSKKSSSLSFLPFLYIGVALVYIGAEMLWTGQPFPVRGVLTPSWVGWVIFPIGLWIIIVSLREVWRNRKLPKEDHRYTPEEIARARAELDALYPQEDAVTPDKSGQK